MSAPLIRHCLVDELPPEVVPYELLGCFSDSRYAALLENPGPATQLGRYSFLAVDPFHVFRAKREHCWGGGPDGQRPLAGKPLDELEKLLKLFRGAPPEQEGLPPMLGGAVGYLAYEVLYEIERIAETNLDELEVPDVMLVFYHSVIARDELTNRVWVAANGFGKTQEEAEASAREARKRLDERIAQRLKEPFGNTEERTRIREWRKQLLAEHPQLHEAELPAKGAEGKLNGRQYAQMVEKAKEHIFAGDIFEVCVSNRFLAPYSGTSERLYQCLRSVNEAPFASYLRSPEVEVISSSPERFMRLDRQGWAETRPIKGTRPRGATPEQDEALRESLRTEEKDQAENIMIVDLARNDLGRVCEFGTVRAPELRIVETYPFNHQLVSTVRGKLLPGRSPVDLIRASYPGGSMTGAPKVEAMKIIARLEPVNRGIFSGAIGYFGYDGAMDLNIVIRTLVRVGDMISFHVGGAIVADSDPDAEYQETLDKAYGLVSAIGLARAS